MKKASIVITTCHNAASYRITKWFQPIYLVADEAGQLTDAELIIAATACKDLRQILLLGGLTQLERIVTSTTRNEFSWARKSTFMGRVLGHVDSTHLWVQYRMTNVIAKPLSIFFYKSLLRNAVGLDIPGPHTLMIRRFISEFLWKGKKEAGKVEEMVFVDLPNSRSWKDVDGESRINMPEAKCIVDMIAALFNFDTALVQRFTLAVICMYKSQAALIRKLLTEKFGAPAASVEVIDISTVDSFQGKENKIVLLSMVHHGNDAADQRITTHLQDGHRLGVAISRASFGFILVGNFQGLKFSTDHRRKGNQIRRELQIFQLLQYYEQNNQLCHLPADAYIDDSRQKLNADFQQRLNIGMADNHLRKDAPSFILRHDSLV
jgi:superfamily I DNA and/or RNA helicase